MNANDHASIEPSAGAPLTKRVFRPRWIWALVAAAFAAITIHLGNWQGGKADYKIAQQAQLNAASSAASMPFTEAPQTPDAATAQRYQSVVANGRFVGATSLFVDNRIQDGKAGYAVVQVLAVETGGSTRHVLVDRGWLAAAGNHATLPKVDTPNGNVAITGRINVPVSRNPGTADNDGQSQRLNYINLAELSKQVGVALAPFVLEQTSGDGFLGATRAPPGLNFEKNRAYQVQWYAFAVLAAVLFVVMSFRKVPVS